MRASFSSSHYPCARPISDFAVESLDGEMVLLDPVSMEYHSLDNVTSQVWRLANGERDYPTISAIASLDPSVVELSIWELTNAGLMLDPLPRSSIDRRRLLRAAAVLTGALVIPTVTSITAPESASAQSRQPAPSTTCNYGGQCSTGCCRNGTQTAQNCANNLYAASNYNYQLQAQFNGYCYANFSAGDFCSSSETYTVTVASVTASFTAACK